METRGLGDSEVEVSVVGLGCNQLCRRLDLDGTRAVVDAALDSGITFVAEGLRRPPVAAL
jgi:aryl-alcohol dehydrogenase-like predicted oxidoreductase